MLETVLMIREPKQLLSCIREGSRFWYSIGSLQGSELLNMLQSFQPDQPGMMQKEFSAVGEPYSVLF